jgi:hypothetical protein
MSTPSQADAVTYQARLNAAGINRAWTRTAAYLIANEALSHEEAYAHCTTVITLAQAGEVGNDIISMLTKGRTPHVTRLLAHGVAAEDILDYLARGELDDATVAIDAGYRADQLDTLPGTGGLTVIVLLGLHHLGMPAAAFDTIRDTRQPIAHLLPGILANGGTWPDITTILAAAPQLPTDAIAAYAATLPNPAGPDVTGLPSRVRVLAAILTGLRVGQISGGGPAQAVIEQLPVAAAITGQPWESTALTLLRDNQAGDGQPRQHLNILTARALENDPTVPVAITAPTPWAGPPSLAGVTPTGKRSYRDGTPRDVLTAAGAPADAINDTLDWLNGHAHILSTRRIPEVGSWGIPAWDAIGAALAAGTSVTDLRLTSTLISRGRSLTAAEAALIHACGISRDTAEQWAREGADLVTAALHVAYGLDERTAIELGRTDLDAAWHAVELLAGGVPPEDILPILPMFTGGGITTMWPAGSDTSTGMPIPAQLLTAVGRTGMSLHQANLAHRPEHELVAATPDAVNELTITVTRQLGAGHSWPDTWPHAERVRMYAAAAAGQPWSHQIAAEPDAAYARRNPHVLLAEQVLAARGITSPERAVERATEAAAVGPGAAATQTGANRIRRGRPSTSSRGR